MRIPLYWASFLDTQVHLIFTYLCFMSLNYYGRTEIEVLEDAALQERSVLHQSTPVRIRRLELILLGEMQGRLQHGEWCELVIEPDDPNSSLAFVTAVFSTHVMLMYIMELGGYVWPCIP